ncbi:MAG: urease accessory UreF family protein [Methylovulum sp.]|uniref:urease accessory protein UreF n=1 Tax=Methylovulum sp. TaxID=1916980 RepID=UPI0026215801|nr:urease accessory UreF family protein [Methylovulum sp.]MDD2722543.1 urease accessory UreF family protein [Methylovulum sp.]MDD5123071.1 urease accessory UreF family protein [Methylovulum sp.]
MATDLALLRLLQLASPGLPIGMYSYSQGLERAVDDGLLNTAETAREWIGGVLQQSMTRVDVPVLFRLFAAWQNHDHAAVTHWSKTLAACRETSELRAEDRQTGQALAKLLVKLDLPEAEAWQRQPETTLATLFSLAAARWGIDLRHAAMGYIWGWLENQVLCAVKLVPLGQVAGQQLLQALATQIPAQVDAAALIDDDGIGGSAFGLALASSRHEMQYSRLFRS